jgi:hypothetical protein
MIQNQCLTSSGLEYRDSLFARVKSASNEGAAGITPAHLEQVLVANNGNNIEQDPLGNDSRLFAATQQYYVDAQSVDPFGRAVQE